jgi:hypothetical protein
MTERCLDHQDVAVQSGAFACIVNAMKLNDERVTHWGTDALYWISLDHEINVRTFKTGSDALQRIWTTVALHGERLEVTMRGTRSLYNLGEARSKFIELHELFTGTYEELDLEPMFACMDEIVDEDFGIEPWVPPDTTSTLDKEVTIEL